MILEIGMEAIEQRVLELAGRTRALLRGLGASLPFDRAPHYDSGIVGARFEGRDASRLARELIARGVHVSARHGNLRVSVHFYNNEADLDRLDQELRRLL
jgi:selenocysteine lyase/cysteine desulfurase